MDLFTIRAHFAEASGRRDLVSSDGTDNGADWFINQAQRFLDRRQTTPHSVARHTIALGVGQFVAHVEGLRTTREVWKADSTGRTQLCRKSLIEMRKNYANVLEDIETTLHPPLAAIATTGLGSPLFYCELAIRVSPQQNDVMIPGDRWGHRYDMDGALVGDSENMRGILILPGPDTAITLSVWGEFFSKYLKDDTDRSFWTAESPHTLVAAACYMLERHFRNLTGAKAWLEQINEDLRGINRDVIAAEMAGIDQMEG